MSCLLKLLVVLALPLATTAAAMRGGSKAPVTDDGDDWIANAELRAMLRDALSRCISSSVSPRTEVNADGGGRFRRAVVNGSREGGSGDEEDSWRRDDSSEKLDVGHVTPFNLPPCVPTDHRSEAEARKKMSQSVPDRCTGYDSNWRSGSSLDRTARSLKESNNTDVKRSDSNKRTISPSSISSTGNDTDVMQTDSDRRRTSPSNTSSLSPTDDESSQMRSDSKDVNAKYQYEVPEYGDGYSGGNRGSDSNWGGGGVGGGNRDYRFGGGGGGSYSGANGGGSYSGGNGGGSGYYGGYNTGRDMENRGGYSGGGNGAGHGSGYGNNGGRNGFAGYGSENNGNNRNNGFNGNGDSGRGLNNGNNRNNGFNGNGDSGGGLNNGNNRNRNEGCRGASKCCESDGETYRKVGSGGYSGKRKNNRSRRGNSYSRNCKFNGDSAEDDDTDESASDEDDDGEDSNNRSGNGCNGSKDDDRRQNGNRPNDRGRRETRKDLLKDLFVSPSEDIDEGRTIRLRITCAEPEKQNERRTRSVGDKMGSRDGGNPCAVQCALTQLRLVDDLGFPCEETMRRVLRKVLGDKVGGVAATAVSRCLLRISSAANNDVCDAADRLMACLFVDVDAMIQAISESDSATSKAPLPVT